jgi:hypothetical protein
MQPKKSDPDCKFVSKSHSQNIVNKKQICYWEKDPCRFRVVSILLGPLGTSATE